SMELQPFNPRHAPLVASWILDTSALRQVALEGATALSPDLILRWVEESDHTFMLLPEPDALPVAYGELYFPREVAGVWARRILVDPRFRGRGYGWTVLERLGLVTHARFGYDHLQLTIDAANNSALSLLSAMGFATLGQRLHISFDGSERFQVLDLSATLPFAPYKHRERDTLANESGYGGRKGT
ncbi:MAG: GNAT family N-acetyltransferase, partial [bacterium]